MIRLINIWKGKNYRSKWQLLLWSVVPLLLLCYLLAFRKTYRLVKDYSRNILLAQQYKVRQDSLSAYNTKLSVINEWKKQYLLDSAVMDASLIAKVNRSFDELGVNLKEYKPLRLSARNIWTRTITIEGDFKSMLQLIYRLEQQDKICRIASVNFQKVKLPGSDDEELNCMLYIQNIIKH